MAIQSTRIWSSTTLWIGRRTRWATPNCESSTKGRVNSYRWICIVQARFCSGWRVITGWSMYSCDGCSAWWVKICGDRGLHIWNHIINNININKHNEWYPLRRRWTRNQQPITTTWSNAQPITWSPTWVSHRPTIGLGASLWKIAQTWCARTWYSAWLDASLSNHRSHTSIV